VITGTGIQLIAPQELLPNARVVRMQRYRDDYFKELLLLALALSMLIAELLRLLLTAARLYKCSEYGLINPPPVARDKPVVADKCAACWHACYMLMCAALVAFALVKGALSSSSGLDWELWLAWLSMNMLDMILQTVLRTLTAPLPALGWTKFVAPKVAVMVIPGLSDRVDILLDIIFTGLCFQVGSRVGYVLAVVSVVIIASSYGKIYCTASLRKELRGDHLSILEPPDPDTIVLADAFQAWRHGDTQTAKKFNAQMAVNFAKPVRQSVTLREDIPQAVMKLFCILMVPAITSGSVFVWASAVISITKAILMWFMWKFVLVRLGTPLALLFRMAASDGTGNIEDVWFGLLDHVKNSALSQDDISVYLDTFDDDDKLRLFMATLPFQPSRRNQEASLLFEAIRSAALAAVSTETLIQAIEPMLEDPDKLLRTGACKAMAYASPLEQSAETVRRLTPRLQDAECAVRCVACIAIAGVVPHRTAEMLESIRRSLENASISEREDVAAQMSRGALRQEIAAEVVQSLAPVLLKDSAREVRYAAFEFIELMTPPEKYAEVLAPWLLDSDTEMRLTACKGIVSLAPAEKRGEAFDLLKPRLQDKVWEVRAEACRALADVAPPEKCMEAFQLLAPQLKHSHWGVRQDACHAIVQAAPLEKRREASELLQPLLQDVNPNVALAAQEGISRLDEAGGGGHE